MKKTICMLLGMLLLMCACAMAEDTAVPREGLAVAAPEEMTAYVPMWDKPGDGGSLLMNYFSGARLTVVRVPEGDYVQVQAGEKGASVMGYMRKEDLRYGAQAMREVPAVCAAINIPLEGPEGVVYSHPDSLSPVAWMWNPELTLYTMGISANGFLQMFNVNGVPEERSGFVPAGAVTMDAQEQRTRVVVEPVAGELTRQQAYDRAIELLLDNPGLSAMRKLPQELRTREGLRSMQNNVRLQYNFETGEAVWDIFLQNWEDYENNITIMLTPQGELISAERGNG